MEVLTQPQTTPAAKTPFGIVVLLVDDQAIVGEAVKKMLESQPDITFYYCQDASKALEMAAKTHPTVILQDLVMPEIDGLLLVKFFRANAATKDVPLIVLSSKEEPKIKAEAFALGANDYMVKLPDKVELIARVKYHSSAYIRLLERNEAYEKLAESQRMLNAELAEAAAYVCSLLPQPIEGIVSTSWRYVPSMQLGGDAFGYHWLDDDHFAIYLLDVCGHGVGAALLGITVMNVLRSESLNDCDFKNASAVLESLNNTFPMEKHNNMYFTIWYGVYNKTSRILSYSSGGHPPAILFSKGRNRDYDTALLTTPGLVIGGMPEAKYESKSIPIKVEDILYVFSDGVYEIAKEDGSTLNIEDFVEFITESTKKGSHLDKIQHELEIINKSPYFADDFSIVKLKFS